MPLPSGGTPWPPPHLADIYDQYAVHDAWYVGDPEGLAGLYGDRIGDTRRPANRPYNRPSQYRGGVVGGLARMWWGRPTPDGERRTKLHIPVASDIATISAGLLYSEPPTATVSDTTTQDRLNELTVGLHAALLEVGEISSALGGGWLRAVWDTEISDKPWSDVVHPDAAVPEWRWGRPAAVTFWRVVEVDGSKLIRHLERHEPGYVLHGLYDGGPTELGKEIDLGGSGATRGLTPIVETGIPKLTANYVPNIRPNRAWRHNPYGAPLGRSDYSDAILGLMDALDETYSSLMRDLRLAKARLVVPSTYLTSGGPGQGASFNLDQELYEAVSALPAPGMNLEAHQFDIRVDQHLAMADDLFRQIVGMAGYSPSSFGLRDEGAAVTATEVMARNRKSFMTRGTKMVYQGPEIADHQETLLMLDAVVFKSGVIPERPDLEFGDSVSEDPKSTAETVNLLHQAEAASIESRVRRANPEWDIEQVEQEVQKIKDEQGSMVGDPLAVRPFGAEQDPGEEDPDTPPDNEQLTED
jgi:hypothetical protein